MRTEREKRLAGELYNALDPELVVARTRVRNLCQALNTTQEGDDGGRRAILRELIRAGGDSVWMQPPFYCDHGANIALGERLFFNFNCIVLDVCPVRIGDFSQFGPGVQILTPLHPLEADRRGGRNTERRSRSGRIWVGAGALILAAFDRIRSRDRRRQRGHA